MSAPAIDSLAPVTAAEFSDMQARLIEHLRHQLALAEAENARLRDELRRERDAHAATSQMCGGL